MDYRSNRMRQSFSRSPVHGSGSGMGQRMQSNRRLSSRHQRSHSLRPWSNNRRFSRPSTGGGGPPRWDPFVHERPQASGSRMGSQQFRGSSRSSFRRSGQTGGRFASQRYGSANRFQSGSSGGRREIKSIIGQPPDQWLASRGRMSSHSRRGASGHRMGANRRPFSAQRMGANRQPFSAQRRGPSPPRWDPFVQDIAYGS